MTSSKVLDMAENLIKIVNHQHTHERWQQREQYIRIVCEREYSFLGANTLIQGEPKSYRVNKIRKWCQ